jgi:hypothetical protein
LLDGLNGSAYELGYPWICHELPNTRIKPTREAGSA